MTSSSRREVGVDIGGRPGPAVGFRAADILFVFGVCVAFSLAAARAFPTMDDGYLDLIVREQGAEGLLKGHPDRPLMGLLLSGCLRLFGSHFWQFAFVSHAVLWTLLGVETSYLWRLLAPSWSPYAVIAGLLAVSPIVIQTQLCTASVTLVGVLSVVLAYAGLFALMRTTKSTGRTALGLGLIALAVLISEYAVAATGVAAVLLATGVSAEPPARRRQLIRAMAVVVVTIAAYSAFLLTSDLRIRPTVDPLARFGAFSWLLSFPMSLASRIWHVLLGAYGTAFGDVQISNESRSSVAGVVCGGVISAAAVWILRSTAAREPAEGRGSTRIGPLLTAVTVGLVPVAFMRTYLDQPFMTRLHIPVMPAAAVLTMACLLRVVRPRFQMATMALLAFVAGTALFMNSWSGISRQRQMSSVGREIEKSMGSEGLTAVVLSTNRLCDSGYSCTAEATVGWPLDLEKRTWVIDPVEGARLFGSRAGCRSPVDLDVSVRSVRRLGRVNQLLWVQFEGDKFRVEPYCNPESKASREEPARLAGARDGGLVPRSRLGHVAGDRGVGRREHDAV